MMDTFRPLHVAQTALALEDKNYFRSWVDDASAAPLTGGL